MIPLPWYPLRQRWTVCEDIRTAQHSAQRNLKIIIPVVTVYVIIVGKKFTFNARERLYFISVSSCVSITYNIIGYQFI